MYVTLGVARWKRSMSCVSDDRSGKAGDAADTIAATADATAAVTRLTGLLLATAAVVTVMNTGKTPRRRRIFVREFFFFRLRSSLESRDSD
jgi:hypothetical protein